MVIALGVILALNMIKIKTAWVLAVKRSRTTVITAKLRAQQKITLTAMVTAMEMRPLIFVSIALVATRASHLIMVSNSMY